MHNHWYHGHSKLLPKGLNNTNVNYEPVPEAVHALPTIFANDVVMIQLMQLKANLKFETLEHLISSQPSLPKMDT